MRTHVLANTAGYTLKRLFKEQQIDERVVLLADDLMYGPLGNILSKDVQEERLKWWEQIFSEDKKHDYMDFLSDSYQKFNQWMRELTDNDSLLFWVGDSPTEHTVLLCLLANLPESIPVSVIMASSAYYKRYGGFRPRSVGEMSSEKLLPLLEDANNLSKRIREGYVKNWAQLLEDNGNLRIRQNRQVETVPVDYFDDVIITLAKRISHRKTYLKSDGFLPAMLLVGEVMGRQKQQISDTFIEWRLRCLIQSGHLTYEGSLSTLRLYKIKPMTE